MPDDAKAALRCGATQLIETARCLGGRLLLARRDLAAGDVLARGIVIRQFLQHGHYCGMRTGAQITRLHHDRSRGKCMLVDVAQRPDIVCQPGAKTIFQRHELCDAITGRSHLLQGVLHRIFKCLDGLCLALRINRFCSVRPPSMPVQYLQRFVPDLYKALFGIFKSPALQLRGLAQSIETRQQVVQPVVHIPELSVLHLIYFCGPTQENVDCRHQRVIALGSAL